MHAIIRQGNGKYYVSAVFGYYNNIKSTNDYQRYIERIHSPYYIVYDEQKEHLVKCFAMKPHTTHLIPLVLIVDSSTKDWIVDENGIGGIDFLPREVADKLTETGELPQDIKEKCLSIDEAFMYEEYHEIKTESDIENLEYASGGFHDAYIEEHRMLKDGTLYLLFEGVWGCKIELWLWGDLEYDTSSRDREEYLPYWLSSSLFFQDDFIYFVDEAEMTVEQINEEYCWFKARHMKYHIIPD